MGYNQGIYTFGRQVGVTLFPAAQAVTTPDGCTHLNGTVNGYTGIDYVVSPVVAWLTELGATACLLVAASISQRYVAIPTPGRGVWFHWNLKQAKSPGLCTLRSQRSLLPIPRVQVSRTSDLDSFLQQSRSVEEHLPGRGVCEVAEGCSSRQASETNLTEYVARLKRHAGGYLWGKASSDNCGACNNICPCANGTSWGYFPYSGAEGYPPGANNYSHEMSVRLDPVSVPLVSAALLYRYQHAKTKGSSFIRSCDFR